MAGPHSIEPTPIDIGVVAEAAFAVSPEPRTMFSTRAARFRALSAGHPLQDYLTFLGDLTEAQHAIQDDLEQPIPPPVEALERAYEFGMPPIDRGRYDVDRGAVEALDRLLDRAATIAMPEPAAAARARLAAAAPEARVRLLTDALESAASVDTLADHVFAGAALQVHFARLAAAEVDAARLKSVGVGACPCCGGPPVASLVVGWASAHGVRYVVCALCGTLWNHVRVKCVACDSTTGIAYRSLSDDGESVEAEPAPKPRDERTPVKAETCDTCRCYVKILHQHLDPGIDPVADDVATLGLDLKVREAGWARAAFNPYLLGY
ncbi:formate dehydrogenase accessory protein FdhE [Hansschlegelia sp. KR7-227]|uniref:formate dehydrogenase accessory protein FdhE n=1 Tax=Hansschlegelia sp. KR7-227 TaxID=3400914 RepID=UPI003BFF72F6